MKIHDKIKDEKLQYDVNREAAYECLTGEEILPPTQSRVIEKAKLTYISLEEALETQIKIKVRSN